jgi:hypothetical protein
VLGDAKRNQLFAIKRLTLQRKAKINLEFAGPKPGQYRMNLYLMSDCYLGCARAGALGPCLVVADIDRDGGRIRMWRV